MSGVSGAAYVELLDGGALALLRFQLLGLQDLNCNRLRARSASHVLVCLATQERVGPCTQTSAVDAGGKGVQKRVGGLRRLKHGRRRTHGVHSVRQRELAVLLVGVVRSRARVIAEPDAKVLDTDWALLANLVHSNDLTVRPLHTAHAAHEVPEATAGNDLVLCEQVHAVHFALRVVLIVLLVGHETTDDLVLRLTTR